MLCDVGLVDCRPGVFLLHACRTHMVTSHSEYLTVLRLTLSSAEKRERSPPGAHHRGPSIRQWDTLPSSPSLVSGVPTHLLPVPRAIKRTAIAWRPLFEEARALGHETATIKSVRDNDIRFFGSRRRPLIIVLCTIQATALLFARSTPQLHCFAKNQGCLRTWQC